MSRAELAAALKIPGKTVCNALQKLRQAGAVVMVDGLRGKSVRWVLPEHDDGERPTEFRHARARERWARARRRTEDRADIPVVQRVIPAATAAPIHPPAPAWVFAGVHHG